MSDGSRLVVLAAVVFAACGPGGVEGTGGGSGGGGGGSATGGGTGASFPRAVKLQGTIELTVRSYSQPGGSVIASRTTKGSFSGTSTTSALGGVLRYSFDQPFTVTGTQTQFDVTLSPRDCTKTISASTGSNLELYVGAMSSGGYVAQLFGDIRTTEDGTCANGGNVASGLPLTLPNTDCPDPAIKVLSNANWLVVSGDPHLGFDLSQDVTCDRSTVKISVSVEGL